VILGHLIAEIETTAQRAFDHKNLNDLGQELATAVVLLESARDWILARGSAAFGNVLAGSVSFLKLLGVVCGAWQMTRAALAAEQLKQADGCDLSYLEGIVDLARFFLSEGLPEADMHCSMMKAAGNSVMAYREEAL
jgi:acyl-CoA dehydrogenase